MFLKQNKQQYFETEALSSKMDGARVYNVLVGAQTGLIKGTKLVKDSCFRRSLLRN